MLSIVGERERASCNKQRLGGSPIRETQYTSQGLLVTRSLDILALDLPRHTTSKLVPSVAPKLHCRV